MGSVEEVCDNYSNSDVLVKLVTFVIIIVFRNLNDYYIELCFYGFTAFSMSIFSLASITQNAHYIILV